MKADTDAGITIIDVPELTWSIGAAVREMYERRFGVPPEKKLRTKTCGAGSHCFAVYPTHLRTDITSIIRMHQTESQRQSVTDILALDIATITGFARGRIGETPIAGSVSFSKPGATSNTDNMVFGNALRWLSDLLRAEPRPDVVIMEALLPPGAMLNHTTRAVRDRLAGLHGVMRGVAHLRGIPQIAEASVGDVRAHFIFHRNAKRETAKRETMRQCEMMGWKAENDNEADALALWSYAASLIDPMQAMKVVPMVMRKRAG
jgi:hypothetical protein